MDEYRIRSPLGRLSSAAVAGVPIDLNAGIRDGHVGSVPIGHTLRAFDALAQANGAEEGGVCFGEEAIAHLEALGRGLDYQCVTEEHGKPKPMEGRMRGVLVRREAVLKEEVVAEIALKSFATEPGGPFDPCAR